MVCFRISFKILVLTFKALNGKAPQALLFQPGPLCLQSRDYHWFLVLVLKHRNQTFGVVALKLWDEMPSFLHFIDSNVPFKKTDKDIPVQTDIWIITFLTLCCSHMFYCVVFLCDFVCEKRFIINFTYLLYFPSFSVDIGYCFTHFQSSPYT